MNRIHIIGILLLVGALTSGNAQSSQPLDFSTFLNNVKNNNIGYLVERYNVDIANANAQAAKVFPDPELSIGVADNQDRTLQMGRSIEAGLSYTIELGGKRRARMQLAQSEAEMTKALLEDYFRNLHADASLEYLGALKMKQQLDVMRSSYKQLSQLAFADSIRYHAGNIMEIDARQSRLEANGMYNEVLQAEVELKNALMRLLVLQGDKQFKPIDTIAGELKYWKHNVELPQLITTALNKRADLQAALASKQVSQRNLQLAKANRMIDLGLSLGASRNSEVRNEIAPAPAFTGVSAGISIPIKFSNTNKGELIAARHAQQQSEASYEAVELQIQLDNAQAYYTYKAACQQVEQFEKKLLQEAQAILAGKTYSYQRGETNLLEVLNAQRTYNDLALKYYDTLYNCMAAFVEMERACGSILE